MVDCNKKADIMKKCTETFRSEFGIGKPETVIQTYDCACNGTLNRGTMVIERSCLLFNICSLSHRILSVLNLPWDQFALAYNFKKLRTYHILLGFPSLVRLQSRPLAKRSHMNLLVLVLRRKKIKRPTNYSLI